MSSYQVVVSPSSQQTRILVRQGPDELLRAILPPPPRRHDWAAPIFVEGLSLWLDAELPVVLCVDDRDAASRLGLTDEMGIGLHSMYYRVEVALPGDVRRRRGRRIQGMGDFGDLRQLRLVGDGEDR